MATKSSWSSAPIRPFKDSGPSPEETGLTVEPGELLGVYDRILRDPEKRVQYHYVLIDFLCRATGGHLQAATDAAEVRWFTREELPALNLAEDTQDVIEKGFAKSGL
jgi:ADP-ribose pyrophosphatase YjhB (NUDIX family)